MSSSPFLRNRLSMAAGVLLLLFAMLRMSELVGLGAVSLIIGSKDVTSTFITSNATLSGRGGLDERPSAVVNESSIWMDNTSAATIQASRLAAVEQPVVSKPKNEIATNNTASEEFSDEAASRTKPGDNIAGDTDNHDHHEEIGRPEGNVKQHHSTRNVTGAIIDLVPILTNIINFESFLNGSVRAKPIVKVGRPWGGQTCNRLLTIGTAFELARANQLLVVIHGEWKDVLMAFADLDRIKRMSGVDFILQESDPGDVPHVVHVPNSILCAIKHSSQWIRDALRPNSTHRAMGQGRIKSLIANASAHLGANATLPTLVSIHLRREDFACKNGKIAQHTWFKKFQACHGEEMRIDEKRFCDHKLDDYYINSLRQDFPEYDYSKLMVFVSTDWQDPVRDETFFTPSTMEKYGVISSIRSPQGTYMGIDMWASVLTKVHVANGYSSCASILAMWRADLHPDGRNEMVPKNCYQGFEPSMSFPMCMADSKSELEFLTQRRRPPRKA